MKVLVVDDVRFMRYYLSRVLKQHGIEAVVAGSGAEALDLLRADSDIEVVITDLIMPEMDGFELKEEAQRNLGPEGRHPVFVLMTALPANTEAQYKGASLTEQAERLGFASVISKPFDLDDLIAQLAALTVSRSD